MGEVNHICAIKNRQNVKSRIQYVNYWTTYTAAVTVTAIPITTANRVSDTKWLISGILFYLYPTLKCLIRIYIIKAEGELYFNIQNEKKYNYICTYFTS